LSYAGNAILNDIYKRYRKKIFYGNHFAIKINQQKNEDGRIYWQTETVKEQKYNHQQQKIIFISKNLVLATGAEQVIEENTHSKYNLKDSAEIFSSDEVLKYDGFN